MLLPCTKLCQVNHRKAAKLVGENFLWSAMVHMPFVLHLLCSCLKPCSHAVLIRVEFNPDSKPPNACGLGNADTGSIQSRLSDVDWRAGVNGALD
jgi:hypothetical protein